MFYIGLYNFLLFYIKIRFLGTYFYKLFLMKETEGSSLNYLMYLHHLIFGICCLTSRILVYFNSSQFILKIKSYARYVVSLCLFYISLSWNFYLIINLSCAFFMSLTTAHQIIIFPVYFYIALDTSTIFSLFCHHL